MGTVDGLKVEEIEIGSEVEVEVTMVTGVVGSLGAAVDETETGAEVVDEATSAGVVGSAGATDDPPQLPPLSPGVVQPPDQCSQPAS